jgi:hypothetical protein
MAADYRNSTDPAVIATRGIRNNNPGNIKDDGTSWQGLAGSDGTFDIFADMSWGVRALAKDLTSKIGEGANTITLILNKYAPATDSNNVPAYINSVSTDTGIDANQVITADPATLALLVRAIANHENGDDISDQYLSDADIAAGVSMASGITSIVQAVPVYFEANPIEAIAITAGVGWILYTILRKR